MEQLLLILAICVTPPLIAVSLITYLFGHGESLRLKALNSLSLNENKGLFKQGALWLSLAIPFGWFLSFGFTAWSGYALQVDAEGFKTFISISTLPLALLAIGLPASVLVSRFHATHQTARQIELTKQKNNVDAFYAHRKEFYTFFDRVPKTKYLGVLTGKYFMHPRLHSILFPGLPLNGTPKICTQTLGEILSDLSLTSKYIDNVIQDKHPEYSLSKYFEACELIRGLATKLGIKEINKKFASKSLLARLSNTDGQLITKKSLGTTTEHLIASYRYIRSYIMNICAFASYHEYDFFPPGLDHINLNSGYLTICPHGPIIEKIIEDLRSQHLPPQ